MAGQILGLGEYGGYIVDQLTRVGKYAYGFAIDTDVMRLERLNNIPKERRLLILGNNNGESKYCDMNMNNPQVHTLDTFADDHTTLVLGPDEGALFAIKCITDDSRRLNSWKYVIRVPSLSEIYETTLFKSIESFVGSKNVIKIESEEVMKTRGSRNTSTKSLCNLVDKAVMESTIKHSPHAGLS